MEFENERMKTFMLTYKVFKNEKMMCEKRAENKIEITKKLEK